MNNLSATTPFSNHVHSVIGKIDQRFRASDLLTGRYLFGKSEQSFPLGLVGGGNLPGFNTVTPTTVNLLSPSYTRVVSSAMLFEARAGFNRFHETFYPEDRDFDPARIGLATVSNPRDFGLPLIRVSGFANLGANLSLPRGRVDTNSHLVGSVLVQHRPPQLESRIRIPAHGRGRVLRRGISRPARFRQPYGLHAGISRAGGRPQAIPIA